MAIDPVEFGKVCSSVQNTENSVNRIEESIVKHIDNYREDQIRYDEDNKERDKKITKLENRKWGSAGYGAGGGAVLYGVWKFLIGMFN